MSTFPIEPYVELIRRYEEVSARMLQADRDSGELVKLYVTMRRLYEAPDRARVIEAVAEIIVSVIGSESFAILEVDGSGGALSLVESMGIDAADFRRVSLATHPIGRRVAPGLLHVLSGDTGSEHEPLVVVPLRFGSVVAGALVIVRLLPHRDALDAADLELLELLALHAAPAARIAALRADAERRPGAVE